MNFGALRVVVESDCREELHHQWLQFFAELPARHESAPDSLQRPLHLPAIQYPLPLVEFDCDVPLIRHVDERFESLFPGLEWEIHESEGIVEATLFLGGSHGMRCTGRCCKLSGIDETA